MGNRDQRIAFTPKTETWLVQVCEFHWKDLLDISQIYSPSARIFISSLTKKKKKPLLAVENSLCSRSKALHSSRHAGDSALSPAACRATYVAHAELPCIPRTSTLSAAVWAVPMQRLYSQRLASLTASAWVLHSCTHRSLSSKKVIPPCTLSRSLALSSRDERNSGASDAEDWANSGDDWKASHPSKPFRTTSVLASGQAGSALHTMLILQVYQAKLLCDMDESSPDPSAFRELRSATDLTLRATTTTAQAIGCSMAQLDNLTLKDSFPRLPGFPLGLVRSCSARLRGVFHGSSEDIPSHASFSA